MKTNTAVKNYANEDILRIARAQRQMDGVVLAGFLLIVVVYAAAALTGVDRGLNEWGSMEREYPLLLKVLFRLGLVPLGLLGFWLASTFLAYKVAKALKSGVVYVYVILMLIPCVGLIVILVLNIMANSALEVRGIRSGLFGTNKDELARLADAPANSPQLPPAD
jgi:hypothetical protein